MSVKLLVHLKAKPGLGSDLCALLKPVGPANDIAGCGGVEVFVNAHRPDEVMIVEKWDTVEAHRAYLDGLVRSGALGGIDELVLTAQRSYFTEKVL